MRKNTDILLKRPPSSIAIELTTRCNLSCTMCSVSKRHDEDLPHDKVLALLDEARALGAVRFDPYGAELFTRQDMPEILVHAYRIGFREIYVVSNGLLLNRKDILEKLEGLKGLVIVVSLDGPKDVHDKLRGKGVFDQAVSALRELGHRGIKRSIATIIMRPTLDRLPEIVDLAADLNIAVISLQPYCRDVAGPGCDHEKFEFKPDEKNLIHSKLNALLKYAGQKNVTIYTGNLLEHVASYLVDGSKPYPPKGCQVPLKTLVVDIEGNCHPCFVINKNMGNVLDMRLSSIWENDIRRELVVSALEKKCPGCLRACSDVEGYNAELRYAFQHFVDRYPQRVVRYLRKRLQL